MRKEILPTVNGYTIRYLTLADTIQIQDLCARCSDYIELICGNQPGVDRVQSIFTEIPAGKTYNDKLLLGIFTSEARLIGILDAIRRYPTEQEWYLNFLLLDPSARNQGLGEKIYTNFAAWVASHGAQAIELTVIERNIQAYRFWQQLGFETIGRKEPDSGKQEGKLLMRKRL